MLYEANLSVPPLYLYASTKINKNTDSTKINFVFYMCMCVWNRKSYTVYRESFVKGNVCGFRESWCIHEHVLVSFLLKKLQHVQLVTNTVTIDIS